VSGPTGSNVTWGSAARVILVEVVTLLALFALQQAFQG
jgi:hypothetical protein